MHTAYVAAQGPVHPIHLSSAPPRSQMNRRRVCRPAGQTALSPGSFRLRGPCPTRLPRSPGVPVRRPRPTEQPARTRRIGRVHTRPRSPTAPLRPLRLSDSDQDSGPLACRMHWQPPGAARHLSTAASTPRLPLPWASPAAFDAGECKRRRGPPRTPAMFSGPRRRAVGPLRGQAESDAW